MRRIWTAMVALSALLATAPFSAVAQEQAPPLGTTVSPASFEDLAGWYEVKVTVPTGSCEVKRDFGGEWTAVVEASRGRRALVLHLEQLESWFVQPVPIAVEADNSFNFRGSVPVNIGAIVPRVTFDLAGGVAQDRQSFQGRFSVKHQLCSFEGTLSGKRTTAPPPVVASVPAPTDQPIGASIFSDGSVPVAPEQPTPLPSPVINGTYKTTLTVTESRCIHDLRGSWHRVVDLEPQPVIIIPLNEYSEIFGGPVALNVEGLRLSQSTTVRIAAGPVAGPVPATFDGAFTADGASFEVRFQAGNALCRLNGTISGARV